MTRRLREVLPASLVAVLRRLGAEYLAGRAADRTLSDALHQIHGLPPDSIGPADGQIASAANLSPWATPRARLLGLVLGRDAGTIQQLRRRPDLAWILIFHRNGYVREIALSRLNQPPASAFMLVALVLRMNDWAEPVRIAARRCLERVLPGTPACVVVAAARVRLIRPTLWGRWRSDAAEVVDRLFQRLDVASALADQLMTETSGPLAAMLRRGLKSAQLDPVLPHLARKARDPSVRAVALGALIDGRASWPQGVEWFWVDKAYGVKRQRIAFEHRSLANAGDAAAWIREGLRDRSVKVRLVAADALTERFEGVSNLDDEISLLNSDKWPAVRERGEFLRRKRREISI